MVCSLTTPLELLSSDTNTWIGNKQKKEKKKLRPLNKEEINLLKQGLLYMLKMIKEVQSIYPQNWHTLKKKLFKYIRL